MRSGSPPTGCIRLMRVATKGGEKEGGTLTQQRMHMAHIWGSERDHQTEQRSPQARGHKIEEEGDPPTSSALKPRVGRGAMGPPQPGSALPQRTSRVKRRGGTPPN